jgi:hypothetical protein
VQAAAFTGDQVTVGIEVGKLIWAIGELLFDASVQSQASGHLGNGNAEGS